MTHEDANNYAAKHPPETELNPRIAEAVKKSAVEEKITCTAAHEIAAKMGVSPADVGATIDLLGIRINECQLGLYGYRPQRKIVKPAKEVSPSLEETINGRKKDNRISCLSCFEIAENLGIDRMEISAACEALKIKISPCRLGSF